MAIRIGAADWVSARARVVGGCCRVGPAEIGALAARLVPAAASRSGDALPSARGGDDDVRPGARGRCGTRVPISARPTGSSPGSSTPGQTLIPAAGWPSARRWTSTARSCSRSPGSSCR
ncbi:MAG: homocysteine S-methyltransferase family protein [Streptosporangiaceae bacterium]